MLMALDRIPVSQSRIFHASSWPQSFQGDLSMADPFHGTSTAIERIFDRLRGSTSSVGIVGYVIILDDVSSLAGTFADLWRRTDDEAYWLARDEPIGDVTVFGPAQREYTVALEITSYEPGQPLIDPADFNE